MRKRTLSGTKQEHQSLFTERMASARRFYNDAAKNAKRGSCSSAITNLMLGASYEGEATAHDQGGRLNRMISVRKLMALRDKTQSTVIKLCAVKPR